MSRMLTMKMMKDVTAMMTTLMMMMIVQLAALVVWLNILIMQLPTSRLQTHCVLSLHIPYTKYAPQLLLLTHNCFEGNTVS